MNLIKDNQCGGKRPGAGRKRGTANRKTREIAERAYKEGLTPLEVMLKTMRFLYASEDYIGAAAIAKDAAPYVHPRLSAITQEISGKDGAPMAIERIEIVVVDPKNPDAESLSSATSAESI